MRNTLGMLLISVWGFASLWLSYSCEAKAGKRAPGKRLYMAFGGRPVKYGDSLRPSEVQEQPSVAIPETGFYTLVMVDPDAPDPDAPVDKFFLHWLVINLQSSAPLSNSTLLPYMPPAPPKGRHRYVFKLYEQSEELHIQPPASRVKFRLREFEKAQRLGRAFRRTMFHCAPDQSPLQ